MQFVDRLIKDLHVTTLWLSYEADFFLGRLRNKPSRRTHISVSVKFRTCHLNYKIYKKNPDKIHALPMERNQIKFISAVESEVIT